MRTFLISTALNIIAIIALCTSTIGSDTLPISIIPKQISRPKDFPAHSPIPEQTGLAVTSPHVSAPLPEIGKKEETMLPATLPPSGPERTADLPPIGGGETAELRIWPREIKPMLKGADTVKAFLPGPASPEQIATQKTLEKAIKTTVITPSKTQEKKIVINRIVPKKTPPTITATNAESLELDMGNAKENPANSVITSKVMNISVHKKSPKKDSIQTLLQQAYDAFLAGQLEVATALYKKVLKEAPSSPTALFGLAAIYQKEGNLEYARELYQQILAKDPKHQDALNNMLMLLGDQSPAYALGELKKLEAINPGYSPILAQIAFLQNKLGNTELAIMSLKKAVLLAPENITYRYNLAILLDKAGYRNAAATLYREVIKASHEGKVIPTSAEYINQRLSYISSQ